MAPERLSGEPSGPPSDLWALGAVLYAGGEGRSPYEGSTPMVIASAVLTKEPPRPQRAGPLAPLLADLLARKP
jgi:eukaryotic-like serine/threonine-protein kinase